MKPPLIENGMAVAEAGEYAAAEGQPAACAGVASVRGVGGFVAADRPWIRRVETKGKAWFGTAEAPFLAYAAALPDVRLKVVSEKLLLAPFAARAKSRTLKPVPMSFTRAKAVTELSEGWAVFATKGRVARAAVEEGETLAVKPEALVAWTGNDPTGFCPRLTLLDIVLPRGPKNLCFTFHGPATVWFEGAERTRGRRGRGVRA